MKKIKLNYEELIKENKQELLNDKIALEEIEKKIEERQMNTNKVSTKT
ncbi:hypothetical protein J2S74_003108 [Evansella vedderi]|uniref:FbpB family small basic protein n=1 Tax=Evansella vedderi TaxID=38282 RepID=A0ABT9ZWX4_9BACI|nr:FbpB family small basic protein [Evansella vedderi]MDQ0255726.1 hypothetical protein [Evansella vedderi]